MKKKTVDNSKKTCIIQRHKVYVIHKRKHCTCRRPTLVLPLQTRAFQCYCTIVSVPQPWRGGGLFMVLGQWVKIYVHGSVHLESVSIIVQRDATVCTFIIFLQTTLHVSDDTLILHQEHTQNCNYNIWHWSNRTCYHPLTRRSRKCSCDSSALAEESQLHLRLLRVSGW